MKPTRVEFFLFADSEAEVEDLEKSLFEFVYDMYQDGVHVKAARLSKAIAMFKDSFLLRQFFK